MAQDSKEINNLLKCYECDSQSVINEGGCMTCHECGWSKKLNKLPYKVPGFSITSFNLNHVVKTLEISPNFRVGWLVNNVSKDNE